MLSPIRAETALDDLDEIVAYIGRRNLPAALKLQAHIEAAVSGCPSTPTCIAQGGSPERREAVVDPNHMVIYEVSSAAVQVRNVIHSRRRYPPDGA